ncbi:unnamed protein product [Sphagnum jensenii]|uniref:Uncharacterized protein n=1 Tax=Sphagnum jensenii TaxID=128206 RepID=A0ABP1A4Y6_9BRYO
MMAAAVVEFSEVESADDVAGGRVGGRGGAGVMWRGKLEAMVAETRAATFQAMEFFVSWQGVLTIAYSGIPPSLLHLKEHIDEEYPGLVKENPGSKWPKTSLACLRDNQRLSMEQLQRLHDICSKESVTLASTSEPVIVNKLSVVLYADCCLEHPMLVTDIPLRAPVDLSGPSADQQASVRKVLDVFLRHNLNSYYFHASKDGNRSTHYRDYKGGVTLVHFLSSIPVALAKFKEQVEEAMPGMYDWFSEESLHVTLRALL